MSNDKNNKKKGFFSRLFGGFSSSKETEKEVSSKSNIIEIPTKSVLNKMKKADIVASAKENGLDLDINLTKVKLIEAWNLHFNQTSLPSAVDDAAKVMAETAVKDEAPAEEAPVEESSAEESAPSEKAPVEESSAEESAPSEKAPVEEASAEESDPSKEAPVEEASAEESGPSKEAPVEEGSAEESAPSKEAPVEEAAPEEEKTPAEEAPVEETPEEEIKVSLEEKTPSQIIGNFELNQMKTDLPEFRPGDTVVVSVKVREGERTRLQAFEGVVMGVKKAGLNSSFIVRKISSGIGVERTFQTHSPMIDTIKVKRKGDVRQAKLFYLRERSGKSARIKERLE